jgi:hypothetical protein
MGPTGTDNSGLPGIIVIILAIVVLIGLLIAFKCLYTSKVIKVNGGQNKHTNEKDLEHGKSTVTDSLSSGLPETPTHKLKHMHSFKPLTLSISTENLKENDAFKIATTTTTTTTNFHPPETIRGRGSILNLSSALAEIANKYSSTRNPTNQETNLDADGLPLVVDYKKPTSSAYKDTRQNSNKRKSLYATLMMGNSRRNSRGSQGSVGKVVGTGGEGVPSRHHSSSSVSSLGAVSESADFSRTPLNRENSGADAKPLEGSIVKASIDIQRPMNASDVEMDAK